MQEENVKDIIEKFREVTDEPYEGLRRWRKANQKKIVGCGPMHFPEELVHAADMLPVVLQETEDPVTEGFSHVHPFFCGISRNIIDIAAKGQLDFFDGLAFSDICVQSRNAALTLKQMLPASIQLEFIQFPNSLTKEGCMEGTLREMGKVKGAMERLSGNPIDDASLKTSISLFNENRERLRQMHNICAQNPKLLSFRDRQCVIQAGMLMPKEEHSRLVRSLVKALEGFTPTDSTPSTGLFLSGHLCQRPKGDILDLVEGTGACILDDDLYTGYRYYAQDVVLNGNPLESLARRHIDGRIPLPTQSGSQIPWDRYIADRVKACGARGVIVLMAKYCEPHLFNYPFIKERLTAAGIPHIMLETEHEVVSMERMRTRLQAFVEMFNERQRPY